ncbi:MAG: hypothetical protein MKZ61_01490 [Flavobacteriales bacterium]|nr:hypothetical protein [Flavobacteriales bacterium]
MFKIETNFSYSLELPFFDLELLPLLTYFLVFSSNFDASRPKNLNARGRDLPFYKTASKHFDGFLSVFNFFENEADFMQKAAVAPRSNCVLNTEKSEKMGIALRPVEDAVRSALRKMKDGISLCKK